MSDEPCLLCGNQARGEVLVSLVRFLEPTVPGRLFDHMPRCVNRAACRARIEAAGLRWEVADTVADLPKEPTPA